MEQSNAKELFMSDAERLTRSVKRKLKHALAQAYRDPEHIAKLTACALCEHDIPVELTGMWEIQCSVCGAAVDIRNPGDRLDHN